MSIKLPRSDESHAFGEARLWRTFTMDRPIAIIGVGTMGALVGWACARAGLATALYDVAPGRAAAARLEALGWCQGQEHDRVAANLRAVDTLPEAMAQVQLAFENVPEQLDLKRRVLGEIAAFLPVDAYMGSNSSSFTCTAVASGTPYPKRVFNMNFSDPRTSTLVEYMGGRTTDPATAEFAKAWARAIGMMVIPVRKEQRGYAFNRLWRVIKRETLRQIDEGIASPEDLDRAWMLSFATDIGPCGMMDEVGLPTVLAIEQSYFDESNDPADSPSPTLKALIAAGRSGQRTGGGFYDYPDPLFQKPGFLTAINH